MSFRKQKVKRRPAGSMTRNHRPVRSPDRVQLTAAADSSSSAPTLRRSNRSVDRIVSSMLPSQWPQHRFKKWNTTYFWNIPTPSAFKMFFKLILNSVVWLFLSFQLKKMHHFISIHDLSNKNNHVDLKLWRKWFIFAIFSHNEHRAVGRQRVEDAILSDTAQQRSLCML